MPNSKSIWVINQFSQSTNQGGSIRHYVLCDELARQGHHVNLFCSDVNNKTGVKAIESSEEQKQFRVTRISVPNYANRTKVSKSISFLVFFFEVFFRGIFLRPAPQIIVGSSPHLLSALAGKLLAKIYNARFYYELRDLWPESASKIGLISEKSLTYFFLEKLNNYLLANAETVITLFSSADNYFLTKGVAPERLRYLPNGCDFNLYSQSVKYISLRREAFKNASLTYIGAIGKPNAVQEILNLALRLNSSEWNATFNIYGSGSERGALEENLMASGIKNCFFHGLIEKPLLPSIAAGTDFFVIVIPYFNGLYNLGFSMNKIFEYMALKRPVIFMIEKPITSEKIVEFGYQLVYGETESMTNDIQAILSSSQEERITKAKLAYQYVRQYHDLRNRVGFYL